MSAPDGHQVRRGRPTGRITRAGVATCGLCGKGTPVSVMGKNALERWRQSSRHGLVHVQCFRDLRGRRPPSRDSRGRFAPRDGGVPVRSSSFPFKSSGDLGARSAPETKSRSVEPVPYGRGRPLPPETPHPSPTTTGLEGRRVTHVGGGGRILEVCGRRALVQPDPVTTRTRTVVRRGRWGAAEVIAGELTEWGPDQWIELRRLSPV